ncbi:MAG: sensor histidine kinase [Eubacterium sp.]|nr:sensor histidine kinase [Eubacterium sp.]
MNSFNNYESTFSKLTKTFIAFAVLPMIAICMAFLVHYSSNAESMTISNMLQMSYYLEENALGVINSVDDTMRYVYEYTTTDRQFLYEILESETLSNQQKTIYVNSMLQQMLSMNSYISSVRFVTEDNSGYFIFHNAEKSVILEPAYLDNKLYSDESTYQKMMFGPCRPESQYVKNSDDNVFSIVRNYFDVSTTANAQSKVLGTIYVDINENVFDEYTASLDVGENGNIYIYNPQKGNYLYSTDKSVYEISEDKFSVYESYFTSECASASIGNMRLIYRALGDTGYYVVIETSIEDIRSGYMENVSFMIFILLLFLFVLVAIYTVYSGRLSGPARVLKDAMQEVQVGNFDVEVDIKTNDEFQYLGDGFNKMLHDLKYYINQVYEAKLKHNISEINALKMQIQPHFLYNTLDVIRMTALENDDPQTAELLESLSDQMRYVTDNKELVTINKELDNIKAYFNIIQVRYKKRLNLKINVSDEELGLYILKFAIQPIVENAVKHGLKEKQGVGTVNVDVTKYNEKLEISIMDDGVGMDEDNLGYLKKILSHEETYYENEAKYRVGIGLKNISDIIDMTYGSDYGVSIESYKGIGTIVTLRLPIIKEGDLENAKSNIGR